MIWSITINIRIIRLPSILVLPVWFGLLWLILMCLVYSIIQICCCIKHCYGIYSWVPMLQLVPPRSPAWTRHENWYQTTEEGTLSFRSSTIRTVFTSFPLAFTLYQLTAFTCSQILFFMRIWHVIISSDKIFDISLIIIRSYLILFLEVLRIHSSVILIFHFIAKVFWVFTIFSRHFI